MQKKSLNWPIYYDDNFPFQIIPVDIPPQNIPIIKCILCGELYTITGRTRKKNVTTQRDLILSHNSRWLTLNDLVAYTM